MVPPRADGLVDWPGLIKAGHVHGFDGYPCQEDYDYLSGILAGLSK